ncbi:FAD-dependent oxidoreductase [Microbacterium trichothecenolyticum]|uniref:6'''-hydroxyparomomycin C oxidase n=1 Tax=Microbacterium trichothecenolyticum TaxID=69370 RepID=A0A0M2HBV5_MICTR|nr:GMC family oxidoreductase [Microbacterium trichothecenolyticum]KJL41682.1 6'''-hydroxyparomomycin C oxidase [Microbacterium trichothecenolyticum]
MANGQSPDYLAAVLEPNESTIDTDIVIVGSGMGGSTAAWALRDSGLRVLVVERGDFMPEEPQRGNVDEVYTNKRYKNAENWYDGSNGKPFGPGVYYWVGGNTKVYGACLPRFRAEDFIDRPLHDGNSPAWPFTYDELEPYYAAIEELFEVRGSLGEDPTEPRHSTEYPAPALPHEPEIQRLADGFAKQGLRPFHMPNAMNLATQADRDRERISDGAPSAAGLKGDAEVRALRPALASGNVSILTNALVTEVLTDTTGERATGLRLERGGEKLTITARTVVLSAGAVNTAALLLRSKTSAHPDGLANGSGLVGRNYMVHNSTFFMGLNPFRKNRTSWQKTLGLNDWYNPTRGHKFPLGNVQMLGKLRGAMVKGVKPWVPMFLLNMITDRTVDLYLTTEDLPDPNNRVRVVGNSIIIDWKPNNLAPHKELVREVSRAVRRAGYPIILTERMQIATNSHQCGTAVAGVDPKKSVLDPDCRAHEVSNLWVIDGSFFPSSAALNPALTIAANTLRVAPKIVESTRRLVAERTDS